VRILLVSQMYPGPDAPDLGAFVAQLERALAEEGVLIYETFMVGNEKYGRPSNPAFLLQPGELLQAYRRLTPIAFEQGYVETPKPAVIQRLCARRGHIGSARIAG
jgi:hypothetical protein